MLPIEITDDNLSRITLTESFGCDTNSCKSSYDRGTLASTMAATTRRYTSSVRPLTSRNESWRICWYSVVILSSSPKFPLRTYSSCSSGNPCSTNFTAVSAHKKRPAARVVRASFICLPGQSGKDEPPSSAKRCSKK